MGKKGSFKIKVLIPIVAIFIVSVLFIAFINYRLLSSAVRKKTRANLELFTDNVLLQMNHLDIILDSAKQTLNQKHIAIAKTIIFMLDRGGNNITLGELQALAKLLDIRELNITNREGIIINSNIPEYIGDNYETTDTTLVYMVLADGTITELSEEPRPSILYDGSYGEVMHFTGVARSGGGFIQLGFNADVISRLQEQINIDTAIKETKIGDNGYGFVLSEGIIISHPNNDLVGADVSNENWYKTAGLNNGFAWINIENKKYYAGYKHFNNYIVMGLVPQSDYYLELNRVFIETIRLLVFSIVVIIIVVYFVLGKLLMPINHLVKGLGKIAESNVTARIEGSYNNEFDKIKNAINTMSDELHVHIQLVSGIEYASKIQRNLLPPDSAFKNTFADYSCIWKPKDIVSGDIYWMKNFPDGAVLCVCDCTGHGTPGALLTMLVSSAFEAIVNGSNYKDTAQIIWELEKWLTAELNVPVYTSERGLSINDGCDPAVLFISKDGSVTISSGHINVFVCDGNEVTRLKGQNIRIGDGTLKSKNDIKVINIPSNPNNKFYAASDGLFEQIGGDKLLPFGYNRLEKIILENHAEQLDVLAEKVWIAFEEYRGSNARRDDFQLVTFKPNILNEGGKQ